VSFKSTVILAAYPPSTPRSPSASSRGAAVWRHRPSASTNRADSSRPRGRTVDSDASRARRCGASPSFRQRSVWVFRSMRSRPRCARFPSGERRRRPTGPCSRDPGTDSSAHASRSSRRCRPG